MISKCFIIFVTIKAITGVGTPRKINTGTSKIENAVYSNYFPDVTYPTNIFDMTEPFLYAPQFFEDTLRPFSDDVKASYKKISSNIPRGNKIISPGLEKKPKAKVLKDVSICVTQPDGKIECAKPNNKESSQEKNPVWLIAEEFVGINNTDNVCDIIEEAVSEYMFKNDILLQDGANVNNKTGMSRSETPINVKINIDVFKGVTKSNNKTLANDVDVLLVKTVPENFDNLHNESSGHISDFTRNETLDFTEQFTRLEELNATNLHDSLTKVLYESSDDKQNISSEVLILQPLVDERISAPEAKANSTILDKLIGLNNVKLIIITAKNKKEDLNDVEEKAQLEKAMQEESKQLEDNDFLDFVISLNDLFQDTDLMMVNNFSDPESKNMNTKATFNNKSVGGPPKSF